MQLGFLHFEVRDPDAWHAFLVHVLGVVSVGDGRYRHDGHAWRIQITEGPADDLAAVGWELDDPALTDAVAHLRQAGHPVDEADPAERSATRRFCTVDPAGIPVELVSGLARATTPFASPLVPHGFVADDQGLGHLVISAPDKAASWRFYVDLLGFRLSDHIVTEIFGHPVDLSFFHANSRHHSLAFGGPQRKRLHHFMLEVRTMDDVGLGLDRTLRAGHRIRQTLGRHPNDRMFSFYADTPSGFQFEYGWGGRQVHDADWEPTTYHAISEWGHHPPEVAFKRRDR